MSKATGNLQRVEVKAWNGRDKISFNLNGAWYGAYLDQMEPDAQKYVKAFKAGDEAEIEYESKTKSDGGTYNLLTGILKIDRPEGSSPAPVQPVGLISKPKWQGGGQREPKENPDHKARSMAFSYVKDLYIAEHKDMNSEWGIDYDSLIADARKIEKYIKEG